MVLVPSPAKPFQNLRRVSPLDQFEASPDLSVDVIQVVLAGSSTYVVPSESNAILRGFKNDKWLILSNVSRK